VATQNNHTKSVILKVSEAVGTALDEFHLAVKALVFHGLYKAQPRGTLLRLAVPVNKSKPSPDTKPTVWSRIMWQGQNRRNRLRLLWLS